MNSEPPDMTTAQTNQIERLSQGVRDARALFSNSALNALYDTDAMPPKLRKAHVLTRL